MKKFGFISLLFTAVTLLLLGSPRANAEGEYAWPANYPGVMLQGFSWDAYEDTQWSKLAEDAGELSDYFDLIWVPNSGKCSTNPSMGYNPVYWFTNHNSSFGTETELREMIKTFNSFGTGIIEDVVVNHRNGVSTWTDFPTETYKGVTYEWGPWAICRNDEVANQPDEEKPTGAYDTGDNFDGCRDLDHTNTKVQDGIKAYLDFLTNDLGYVGFRYDMVKGFGAQYIKIYNESAKARFSVGEYWDGYDNITKWIENTGRTSAAFDFEFKWQLNAAFSAMDFSKLVWKRNGTLNQPAGLIHMDTYQRYAVTFIDNHDTYRESTKFTGDVATANAYMLCCPGTPCVFMKHWLENKDVIKKLIAIRKSVGITNQSTVEVLNTTTNQYVAKVTGTNGELIVKIGRGSYSPAGYTDADKVASSSSYTIWTKVPIKTLDTVRPTVTLSKESGLYLGGVDVVLTATNAPEGAKISYTTDGTTPSATNGTLVASGYSLHIDKKTTVKAVVVSGSEVVSTIKSATYKTEYLPVTIYLKKPEWTIVNFYAWSNDYEAADLLGIWPGKNMSGSTVEEQGITWYKWTTPQECDIVNIIFNNGKDQTVDINDVEGTRYFVLNELTGKSCTVTDVTDIYGGVSNISATGNVSVRCNGSVMVVTAPQQVASIALYSTSGAQVAQAQFANEISVSGLQRGIYLYRVTLADGTVAQGKVVR